jgi:hypothetical protein
MGGDIYKICGKVHKRTDFLKLKNLNEVSGYKVAKFDIYDVYVYPNTRPHGVVGFLKDDEAHYYQHKYPKSIFLREDKPSKDLERRIIWWMDKTHEDDLDWCFGRMDNLKKPPSF